MRLSISGAPAPSERKESLSLSTPADYTVDQFRFRVTPVAQFGKMAEQRIRQFVPRISEGAEYGIGIFQDIL
jgi:hypothetical protein